MPETPPVAKKLPSPRLHHGHTFVDDYEWLRDKSDPEVIAHLEAENAWTAARTGHLTGLADQVFDEIKGRTQETDLSVPSRTGQYWYYTRTIEGKSYAVYCRAPIARADDWTPPVIDEGATLPGEEVMLDANVEAEGHEFFSLGSLTVSSDGTLLAYGTDTAGDERYTLRVRRIATGQDSEVDVILGTAAGAQFSLDGGYLFYTTVDPSWRPDTVWRHEVGTPPADDVMVYTEPDERFWVGMGVTRSRRYLVIAVGSKITSETLLLDTMDPTGTFRTVWPRVDGVEYEVEHAVVAGEDRLLITHNQDAENFEVVDVAADDPTGDRTVVVAHSTDSRIEGVDAFATHLVVTYRRDVLVRIGVIPLQVATATGRPTAAALSGIPSGVISGYAAVQEIEFDEPLFDVGLGSNPEWNQPTTRLVFTSFVTPASVFDYDIVTRTLRLLKRQPVLGGYDPAEYEQARQ